MAYIDREKLRKAFKKSEMKEKDMALFLVEMQPIADGVEVKYGEWLKTDRGIRVNANTGQPMRVYHCECSCCGWHTGHQGIEFNYCPNCGAKMDGGTNNET